MESNILIKINNCRIQNHQKILISQLNWQMQTAQAWLVTGANGSGKAEFLKMLAGQEQIIPNCADLTEKTENGIEISNDVIAVIAGVAVSEVQGVASMSGSFAGGITEVLSGKKNMAKGIKVEKTDNTAKIDVNIIVEYGTRIPDVAFESHNRVKTAVESMTGLKVEEVNVNVQGVSTETTDAELKNEENKDVE